MDASKIVPYLYKLYQCFVLFLPQIVKNLTDPLFAETIRKKIDDLKTYQDYSYYGADFDQVDDRGTAHINVIAPNGDAIAATGTINDWYARLSTHKICSSHNRFLNDSLGSAAAFILVQLELF